MQEKPQDGDTVSRHARLRAAVSYDGQSSVIGQARDFTGVFLDRAAARGVTVGAVQRGDALLVVSELVTNAVRHAPGPCTLTLDLDGDLLEIAVTDTSARPPRAQLFEPERVGQHGLEIVTAVCSTVVTSVTDRGKTVRAQLMVF
ncbi:ATP-binding protein [Actinacidiphila paucisporea]|uniref:Histidine kinase-like ATPase domain-containing protein n=1 Tax=Actinacidiphila paucisporea TaxID=310782 RepID=A0A1M7M6G5_9ACTN|nr:ATP-binding protein [Actinacidiphila paucisporea]SHM86222.1 Histidine kinase-like ATPase domain-containing protein [Actinacidiphila paucisporea]